MCILKVKSAYLLVEAQFEYLFMYYIFENVQIIKQLRSII